MIKLTLRNGTWYLDGRAHGLGRLSLGTSDRAVAERAAPLRLAEALNAKGVTSGPTSGTQAPVGGTTVREAYTLALQTRARWKGAKRPESIEDTYGAVEAYWGANTPLASITGPKVLAWVQHMERHEQGKRLVPGPEGRLVRKLGLSGSTINHRISCLSVLFREADLTPPRMPRVRVAPGRVRVFSAAELEQIEAWFRAAPLAGAQVMADLVPFLAATAMRPGEPLKIRRRDYDLLARTVTLWDTKNRTHRTIPLAGRALTILTARAHLEHPFPITEDRRVALWDAMRTALGHADDHEFVMHALRHTAITNLARAGHNDLSIKAFAGHAQLATTQKYTHLAAADLRGLAESLGVAGAGASH